MAVEFFDTHAHVLADRFGNPEMRRFRLERAVSVGVKNVVVPSVDPPRWAALAPDCAVLANSVPGLAVWFGLGLHPWALETLEPDELDTHLDVLDVLIDARPDGLVAVGECGLDLARKAIPVERQLAALRRHVEIARRHDLPLILHAVRCHHLLPSLLEELRAPPAILHAFHGHPRDAARYLARGDHLSFSGQITGPRPGKLADVVRQVPDDRILLETDCPDQTPWPHRPAPNEPAFLLDVAETVATLRDVSLEALATTTTANARRAFRLAP